MRVDNRNSEGYKRKFYCVLQLEKMWKCVKYRNEIRFIYLKPI